MRDSVRAAFVGFTEPKEGHVPFMYLDVKELVTIGDGDLIDPIQMAMSLPFVRPDASYAMRDEIAAAWLAVKARTDLAPHGGMAFEHITTLRLTREGIDRLVFRKLDQNDLFIAKRFPDYESWPADAQLGILSLAWACGPAFHFPHFEDALRVRDFDTASVECKMSEAGNPGLKPRNLADHILFTNAAKVVRLGLNPDVLWYPRAVTNEPAEEETQPEINLHDEPPDDVA